LKQAITQLNSTLGSFQEWSDNVNAQVQPLSTEIQLTAQRARVTLDEVDKTLKALRDLEELGYLTPGMPDYAGAVKEVAEIWPKLRALTMTLTLGSRAAMPRRISTVLSEEWLSMMMCS